MAGSETPRPGWWRARDGNWYPPEALPPGWFIDVDGGARQRQPVAPVRSEPLPIRTPTYTAAPPRALASRAWWIAAPVAAVLAIAVAAVILLTKGGSNGDDQATAANPSGTLEASRVLDATTVPSTLKAPPAPTQPPTTAPPPTCSVSMSTTTPAQDATVAVVVASDLPNTAVQVSVAYRTTTAGFPATTDAAGAASVNFSVGKATIGFTVPVTVTVGAASCSTSFTTR